MIILDAHCDTITKIMDLNENLIKNSCHFDLDRVKNPGSFVQFFAAFINPDISCGHPLKLAIKIIDKFNEQMFLYKEKVVHCRNYEEIIRNIE